MKTTVEIPDEELRDLVQFTRAKTKREAIVTAITDFNRSTWQATHGVRARRFPPPTS